MKHLTTCNYYNNYLELINDVEKQQALDIQEALSATSRTLACVPAAISNHCWDYQTNDLSFISILRNNEGGPHIYINPWIGGQPNLTDHTVEDCIAMWEEESEESEEEAAGA